MRPQAGLLFAFATALTAQTGSAPALEYGGSPLVIPYSCTGDDLQWAGLTCGDEPCTIYLDLEHAAGSGDTILMTGNLHAASVTLYSVLLRSEDGGRTWREPYPRERGSELDGLQMIDAQRGWISGQTLQPLPMDPFFLLTEDGGKSWTKTALLEDGSHGAIRQFVFDSKDHGLALVDRGGGEMRYEIYETRTGGHVWTISQKAAKPLTLRLAPPSAEWRVTAEPRLFRLERHESGRWTPFASFSLHAAECREQPIQLKEPSATSGSEDTAKGDAVDELRLGSPKPRKGKPRP